MSAGRQQLDLRALGYETLSLVQNLDHAAAVPGDQAHTDGRTPVQILVIDLSYRGVIPPPEAGQDRAHHCPLGLQRMHVAKQQVEFDPTDPHCFIMPPDGFVAVSFLKVTAGGPEERMIGDESIREYLDRTASHAPAPGGGAAAALQLAQAAALTAMSARFTTGANFAQHAPLVERVLAAAQPLIAESLDVGDADAEAFARVADAYALPQGSAAEKDERTAAIQAALVEATEPPQQLIELARSISALGEELLGCANPNILSDITAAAAAARAAATIAQATLEINLASVKDSSARRTIEDRIHAADDVIDFCNGLIVRTREEIAR